MIKPPAIKRGATIGVVCPSKWAPEEELHPVQKFFEDRGYGIRYGRTPFLRDNQFAGTPEDRAEDIMDMFDDPGIDAILCARGGYGANRVIPLLDYGLIKSNPKIFMGYSDITALLHSIQQKTGLVTFHGPMFATYKKGFIPYNWDAWEAVVTGEKPAWIKNPPEMKARSLKPGMARSRLTGGNLTLLINRLGTPWQSNFDGKILFLEDVDEHFYAFDRYLVQLRQSGTVDNITGLIFGELVGMQDDAIPFGKSTDEIILDVFGDLDIPIVTNVACGHGKYQLTLPISIPSSLKVTEKDFSLRFDELPVTNQPDPVE